jgi:hypothetical protein
MGWAIRDGAPGGTVEILVLPIFQGPKKSAQPEQPEQQGERHQKREYFHHLPRSPASRARRALFGRAQADAAAAGAAGVARMLIEGEVRDPGAWMPEQIVDPDPFLSRLAARGLKVEFPAG